MTFFTCRLATSLVIIFSLPFCEPARQHSQLAEQSIRTSRFVFSAKASLAQPVPRMQTGLFPCGKTFSRKHLHVIDKVWHFRVTESVCGPTDGIPASWEVQSHRRLSFGICIDLVLTWLASSNPPYDFQDCARA